MAAINPTLDALIREVSALLTEIAGIQLGEKQSHMVQSKLNRRMLELGISDPADYRKFLKSNLKAETDILVSLLTTHHTYFFREFFHFEYLEKEALPLLLKQMKKEGRKTLRVWSAACSRGQEVYSLAMCLHAYFKHHAPGFDFEILGSDIDTESVGHAKNGVYKWDEIKEIPLHYLGPHWARGTGEISSFVKAKPSIKANCRFDIINLLDIGKTLPPQKFDLIFCRNVFIYFSHKQIKSCTEKLLEYLPDYGFMFLGISETLTWSGLPLNPTGQSIYMKQIAKRPAPTVATPSAAPRNLRVLCVDDSPTILTLMKKILSPDRGFEIVATAKNGIEAASALAKDQTIDLMTLDLHMPEQDGVTYLKQNFRVGHPPVVVVSSVTRENAQLAITALELGASDYVEKPALGDLLEKEEELRTKLRCAAQEKSRLLTADTLKLERSFGRVPLIKDPQNKLRVIFAGARDLNTISDLFREFKGPQPPTVILFRGVDTLISEFSRTLTANTGNHVQELPALSSTLEPNQVYAAPFSSSKLLQLKAVFGARPLSAIMYGGVSKELVTEAQGWSFAQLMVEDIPANWSVVKSLSFGEQVQVVPATSFGYLSMEFFCPKATEGGNAA